MEYQIIISTQKSYKIFICMEDIFEFDSFLSLHASDVTGLVNFNLYASINLMSEMTNFHLYIKTESAHKTNFR